MNALNYPALEGKTNEELFTLYKETHAQEVKQELTMRYVRLGRAPTDEELADYLNMNVKKLQKIQRMSNMVNVLSLDMTYDEGNESLLQIPSADHSTQPEFSFIQKENVRALTEAIESLQEKEKLVISLYYVEELNMNQIAEVMEISQPRVSQLHSIALRKLRKYMGDREI